MSLSYRSSKNGRTLRVLDSINFEARKGDFVAIVGPSGCGKTSILRVIGGLIEETDIDAEISGEVFIDGMTPREARQVRTFGFTFQNPVLLPWRTVRGNVRLPLEIIGINSEDNEDRIMLLLKLMDVHDFADSYPYELSGGIQQRVNIARALDMSHEFYSWMNHLVL